MNGAMIYLVVFPAVAIVSVIVLILENFVFIPRAAWPFIIRNVLKRGVIVALRDDLGQLEFKRMKVDPNQGTLQGNPTEYLFVPAPIRTHEDKEAGITTEAIKAFNEIVQKRTIIKDLNVPFLIANKGSGIAVNPELLSAMESIAEEEENESEIPRLKIVNPNMLERFLTMSITPDRVMSWGKRFERRGKFKTLPVGKIAISVGTILLLFIFLMMLTQAGFWERITGAFQGLFPR